MTWIQFLRRYGNRPEILALLRQIVVEETGPKPMDELRGQLAAMCGHDADNPPPPEWPFVPRSSHWA